MEAAFDNYNRRLLSHFLVPRPPRPYLRNPNVQWFGFDLTDLKTIPIEDDKRENYLVHPGDMKPARPTL